MIFVGCHCWTGQRWHPIRSLGTMLLAAKEQTPLIERLDPQSRATVVFWLVILLVLGVVMIALVSAGARAARRYANSGRASHAGGASAHADDWSRKPLVPRDAPPEADDDAAQ